MSLTTSSSCHPSFKVEPCAGAIVSAAARLSILVGGPGAPPVEKSGDGAGGQKSAFKIPEKISFHPKNFLMTFLRNRKMQQTWHRRGAVKFSAAVHRSPKVGGG